MAIRSLNTIQGELRLSYQREFDKKINVGIIGIGSHGYRNILPLMNYLPVSVKAVCNRNADVGRITAAQYACAHYRSPRDMYDREDIDAVFINVSPSQHPLLVIEALDRGKHVWIEKPIATRAREVEEMITHRKDKVVIAGFKKAFMPAAQKAIEIARSPKYGNLRSILAVYPMTIPGNGREILETGETPNWLNNGVHPLSFLMAVGGRVAAVTAICNEARNGILAIQFANGVFGTLHMSSGPQPRLERYGVYGDNWQMDIENTKITLHRGIPFVYSTTTNYAPEGDDSGAVVWDISNCLATLENKAEFTQGMYDEMMYFCECVLKCKAPKRGSLEFALEMMKVYEAGLLSEGRTIYINHDTK
jgi:predicted dehydrogenase